jgi:lipopolysaccharide/colanic/teichoic acid biosynthesis glycosyltransferase
VDASCGGVILQASAAKSQTDYILPFSTEILTIDLERSHSPSWDEAHLTVGRDSIKLLEPPVSNWSRSGLKRFSDCIFVLLSLPLFAPILLFVGLAVRLTSRGPVLFSQTRSGLRGKRFTILKFRTMEHLECGTHKSVTTEGNQRFTSIGPFLRRWKLDELPQLFNVLAGDMSLVGPRPKMPEHQLGVLCSRPGITGAATLLFVREELVLANVRVASMDAFYHSVILPAKHQVDREYMAGATFLSDLKLIISTVLGYWDSSTICEMLHVDISEIEGNTPKLRRELSKFRRHAQAILAMKRWPRQTD